MRCLFVLLLLPFVLLPNCGGRASSPRGSGGEGGTDSGSTETGGSGSGGKGSSTGGKGSSTGGHGEATGGAGGENQSGTRTIEIHLYNDGDEPIFIQWHANYCPEFLFKVALEGGRPWEYESLGSVATLGSGFGYVDCSAEAACEYVDSAWTNAPIELQGYSALYRKVDLGDSFVLFISDVSEKDVQVLRDAGDALGVSVGGFVESYSWWKCNEEDSPCKCEGNVCALPEVYENELYYEDEVCTPSLGFVQRSIEWDTDPIRVDVEYWL